MQEEPFAIYAGRHGCEAMAECATVVLRRLGEVLLMAQQGLRLSSRRAPRILGLRLISDCTGHSWSPVCLARKREEKNAIGGSYLISPKAANRCCSTATRVR